MTREEDKTIILSFCLFLIIQILFAVIWFSDGIGHVDNPPFWWSIVLNMCVIAIASFVLVVTD